MRPFTHRSAFVHTPRQMCDFWTEADPGASCSPLTRSGGALHPAWRDFASTKATWLRAVMWSSEKPAADPTSTVSKALHEALASLEERLNARFDKIERSIASVQQVANASGEPDSATGDHDEFESTIRRFADEGGKVDATRFAKALQELGLQRKGSMQTPVELERTMGAPLLSVRAAALLAQKMGDATAGNMPSAALEEAIMEDALNDPWTSVLRGDPQVRGMMKELRTMARATTNILIKAPTDQDNVAATAAVSRHWHAANESSSSSTTMGMIANGKCGFPVLHPDGRFRSGWNVVIAALICFCAIGVPLEIAYESSMRAELGEQGWQAWEHFNLSVDIIFIVDICLNFRTGFLIDGLFITNECRIASNYLRGAFVVDLLGSFPINFILEAVNSDDANASRLNRQLRLLRIMKLNRLLRLSKLTKYLKYVEILLEFNPSFWRVLKLMLLMMACCHWMGCTWWLITDVELGGFAGNLTQAMNDWQPTNDLLQGQFGEQFAAGFFWGAGMVTAMIAADVVPSTPLENYVTAICMFIGLMLNAFVIGSMASALSTMDSKKQMCRGKLETIGLYLLVNNVHTDLRSRILEYYEYVYTSSQSMEDLRLLQDLPPSLATRLAISIHRRIVARAPLFSALSDISLLHVLARLTPVIYVPGQIVMVEGEQIKMVNFIKKGHVSLLKQMGSMEEKEVRVLGPSDNFGLDDASTRQLIALAKEGDSSSSVFNRRGSAGAFKRLSVTRRRSSYGSILNTAIVRESARADTYCDVVSLDVDDLTVILSRDKMIRKAKICSESSSGSNTKNIRGITAMSVIARLRGGLHVSRAAEHSNTVGSPPAIENVPFQPCAPPSRLSSSASQRTDAASFQSTAGKKRSVAWSGLSSAFGTQSLRTLSGTPKGDDNVSV